MGHPLRNLLRDLTSTGLSSASIGLITGMLAPNRIVHLIPKHQRNLLTIKCSLIFSFFTTSMKTFSSIPTPFPYPQIPSTLTSMSVVQLVYNNVFNENLISYRPLKILINVFGTINFFIVTCFNIYEFRRPSLSEDAFLLKQLTNKDSLTPIFSSFSKDPTTTLEYEFKKLTIKIELRSYHFLDSRIPALKDAHQGQWLITLESSAVDLLSEYKGGLVALKKRILIDLATNGFSLNPSAVHFKEHPLKKTPKIDKPTSITRLYPPYSHREIKDNLKAGSSDSQHVQLTKFECQGGYWPALIKYYPKIRNHILKENDQLVEKSRARYVVLIPATFNRYNHDFIHRFFSQRLNSSTANVQIDCSDEVYTQALTPPLLKAIYREPVSSSDEGSPNSKESV